MNKTALSIVIVMLLAAHGIAAPTSGPKISAKEVRYDAGKVKQGTDVSHIFEITNAGTATLFIQSVQPG